jgi:L-threonylcarbamoyladenylate synthase
MQLTTVIAEAATTLRMGNLIAYPTEAVYGLGCDLFNEAAVTRLLLLKKRSVDKGLILVGKLGNVAGPTVIRDVLTQAVLRC